MGLKVSLFCICFIILFFLFLHFCIILIFIAVVVVHIHPPQQTINWPILLILILIFIMAHNHLRSPGRHGLPGRCRLRTEVMAIARKGICGRRRLSGRDERTRRIQSRQGGLSVAQFISALRFRVAFVRSRFVLRRRCARHFFRRSATVRMQPISQPGSLRLQTRLVQSALGSSPPCT